MNPEEMKAKPCFLRSSGVPRSYRQLPKGSKREQRTSQPLAFTAHSGGSECPRFPLGQEFGPGGQGTTGSKLVVLQETQPACSPGARTPPATPGPRRWLPEQPTSSAAATPGYYRAAAHLISSTPDQRDPSFLTSPSRSEDRPLPSASQAHRHPPGGVRTPGFGVELV